MNDQPPDPPSVPCGHGHFDRSLLGRPNLPQLGGALVAEQSALAAGQHGRHPTAEATDLDVSDREDPAVKTAEATGGPAVLNGAWSEAKLEELAAGDHAVLAARHLPSATAVLVGLPRYSGEK
jgi:hypothetical protein